MARANIPPRNHGSKLNEILKPIDFLPSSDSRASSSASTPSYMGHYGAFIKQASSANQHPRVSQFGHSAVPQHYLHQNLKGELFAPIGPMLPSHRQPTSRFNPGEFYSDSSDSGGFNSEHEGTSQNLLRTDSDVYEGHGSGSDRDSAFETHSAGEHNHSDSESLRGHSDNFDSHYSETESPYDDSEHSGHDYSSDQDYWHPSN
ncbi:hypothetical protein B0H11DRAFT_1920617 [Mycena galericulata]|nr:hypothetical protein B0H11DRAFT_1920617 [Mycena galericulata]